MKRITGPRLPSGGSRVELRDGGGAQLVGAELLARSSSSRSSMAPKYEVVMLATAMPKQTPKLFEFLKEVSKQLWATGAVIADLKSWGSRPLAYRIRQHSVNHYHAHYLGLHLYCSPKALDKLAERLRNEDLILRHMALKEDTLPKLTKEARFPLKDRRVADPEDLKADAMEAAKYEYRNLVMQRIFEGPTEQEMLAEQMTQARFMPQQAWFQEPAHRKNARLYEVLKQPPPALPSRAANGELSGAIEAPDGGAAAAPPSDAAGGGPPKDPER